MSGYDIKKMVDSILRHFWSESYGRLYPTLRELEAGGLATSSVEPGDGKPDRIVYTITDAGRRVLEEWLTEPAAFPRARLEVLLKLFFAYNVPIETSIEQVKRQREAWAQAAPMFDGFERMVQDGETDPDKKRSYRLTIMHGRLVNEARIRWCDEALAMLESDLPKTKGEP
jgi:DNA-binding PadR family transcriptional regulator